MPSKHKYHKAMCLVVQESLDLVGIQWVVSPGQEVLLVQMVEEAPASPLISNCSKCDGTFDHFFKVFLSETVGDCIDL